MASTQVRISEATHTVLKGIASETGDSLQRVVETAIERYRRELFLENLNRDFGALKGDDNAWQEELDERELWNSTLADGEDQS
jgi:hypothetical protein